MTLVFLKKPSPRKGLPLDRYDAPATCLDLMLNPILVDEMKRHTDRNCGQYYLYKD